MKAKVIALNENAKGKPALTTIHGKPVKMDQIVDIEDENTLRNLVRKGIVEPHDADAKTVNLEEPSRLSEEDAKAQAEAQFEEKQRQAEKEKAAAEAAKKKPRK